VEEGVDVVNGLEVFLYLVETERREEYNNIVFGNARTWRNSFGSDRGRNVRGSAVSSANG